jgi:ribokinase
MRSVWIAGSVNMDIVATAVRHPKIGETVVGREVFFFPGGKGANQAVAAAKLGAPTALIGKVGDDAFGRELRQFLAAQNVDLKFLRDTADARTGTAVITVADADKSIVVVPGANALLSERDVAGPVLDRGDVAVSQFEIPLPTVAAFFSRARSAGATTILNPAPAAAFDRGLLDLVDILILNETELAAIAGEEVGEHDPDSHIVEAARVLQRRDGQSVVVTLGRRGAVAWAQQGRGKPGHDRRRRLLRRSGRCANRVRRTDGAGTGIRERGRFDLRSADGRRALDAHRRRGRGKSPTAAPLDRHRQFLLLPE